MLSTIITAAFAALITTGVAEPPPPNVDRPEWLPEDEPITAPDADADVREVCSPCLYGCSVSPQGDLTCNPPPPPGGLAPVKLKKKQPWY